ncbi:hypothetical protein Salat_1675400 [Sesamum alatum]|uniref:Reverse transcriptase zinc-binding domain-containing protein n=1 Tax=Sesamum alatum TaxID=300844 RepID=A0AAE2CJU2_9LAMI|nr:hypothetical protein Salat_1675400 [Sesamum alatum]
MGCEIQHSATSPMHANLTWKFTTQGKFTVRSAYRAIMEAEERERASSSTVQPRIVVSWDKFWTKLWVVPVPPRVRLQVWKFCAEAVPTLQNLQRRRPKIDQQCIQWGANTKNTEMLQHMLLECPFTKIVWALSNIPWCILSAWIGSISEWFSSVFQQLNRADQQHFLTLCWALWQNRNKAVMEGQGKEPLKVADSAFVFLQNYQAARRSQEASD